MVKARAHARATPDLVLASASPRRRELLERVGLALWSCRPTSTRRPAPGERPPTTSAASPAAKCDAHRRRRRAAPRRCRAGRRHHGDRRRPDPRQAGRRGRRPRDAAPAGGPPPRGGDRLPDPPRRPRGRAGGHDGGVLPLAARPPRSTPTSPRGEWRGKAGGYAVQGIAGAFVTELRGSLTNVIGLPLAEVLADLQALRRLPRYPPPAFGAGGVTRAEEIAGDLAARARPHRRGRARGGTRRRVRAACSRSSKKMPADDVRAALAAGQRDFGENYGQELRDKRAGAGRRGPAPALALHRAAAEQQGQVRRRPGRAGPLGGLRRAARRAIDGAAAPRKRAWCRSTSPARRRSAASRPRRCRRCWTRFAALPHVRCEGLMMIPPLATIPRRRARTSRRCARCATRGGPRAAQRGAGELSMGMSHDLEVAIAEGATLVRVGTAIFGPRAADRRED